MINNYINNIFKKLLVIFLPVFYTSAHAQIVWKLASAYPDNNFHTENLKLFAKDIQIASRNQLKIVVYPNATLVKAPDIKGAVQKGEIAAGEILLANFEAENPILGLDNIPYLAASYVEGQKLEQVQLPYLEKFFATQDIKLMYTVPWPPQGIYSKKKLDTAHDLYKTNWRAYSPATSKLGTVLGANPITVQAAELTKAFAENRIDTMMSSSATGYDSKIYNTVPFWYDTQAWLPKNALIINTKEFDKLPKDLQTIILQAAHVAHNRGWKMSQEKNAFYKRELFKQRMQILAPPLQLNQELRKVGTNLLDDWLAKSGADGKRIITQYREQQVPIFDRYNKL